MSATSSDPNTGPVRLLQLLRLLHLRGLERLRASFIMSPSGCHWRMHIVPASLATSDGLPSDFNDAAFTYSSSQENALTGLGDAASSTTEALADAFMTSTEEPFVSLVGLGRGSDAVYVEWYAELLAELEKWEWDLPYMIADWPFDGSVLNTLGGRHFRLPPPPLPPTANPRRDAAFVKASTLAKSGAFDQLFKHLDEFKADFPEIVNATRSYSLLQQAAWWGNADAAKKLRALGADASVADAQGETALDIARRRHPANNAVINALI